MNYLRTTILLAALTALFMAVGYLIGGGGGAEIALLIAAVTKAPCGSFQEIVEWQLGRC